MKTWTSDNLEISNGGRYHFATEKPDPYPEAVCIARGPAVAWHVLGVLVEPDEDTEWSGIEVYADPRQYVCVMVGDDRPELVDPDDIRPMAREDYCGECGQIGCYHDGLDRE